MEEKSMECFSLPEGCIASILSRTTPIDTCKLSLVSTTFYSASLSDSVWNTFLPNDYTNIISRSLSHTSLFSNSSSKKSIFQALSKRPIMIDNSTKSFQLDRKSGKKCYMLGARALTIVWGDTDYYWRWINKPESRFPEVAELCNVCWLEIHGVLNTNALSPNTHYAAYLVFKVIDNARGFREYPVELSIDTFGGHNSKKNVCLTPNAETLPGYYDEEWIMEMDEMEMHERMQGLPLPNVRSDGWLEIEMGNFFSSGLEDEEVQLSVMEINGGNWKSGLIIEGIEVRPKDAN
ncbi:hypothetical protein Lal_00000543 [Lupinus albus]|uniref:Putative phloem protein n=1 Tax=Lupinus albus TaxID=3870 RepID=A0A6A5LF99_LUPAL|nr:putative phloem protein [Lupinus albus]KAF1861124.1 hypothetical protein Lal_00000543 [Lupinus albus]